MSQALRRGLLLFALGISSAMAAPSLNAPATAKIGSEVTVSVNGNTDERAFVSIVAKGTREGAYTAYQYAKGTSVKLTAPSEPGDYEIRLLSSASPYPTVARVPLKLETVSITLDAPDRVDAGSKVQVLWTGPNNDRDYIGFGETDPKGRPYLNYVYTRNGSPITLIAPDKSGAYELRYFFGDNKIMARRSITVGSVAAAITIPAQVAAGANFSVQWQGPNNPRDFVTIVPAGAAEREYDAYAYTAAGNPAKLRAPDAAGNYEVRYLTGQSYATLGSAKLVVGAVTASVEGPAQAVAGSSVPVKWQGPNNLHDYITLVPTNAAEGQSGAYAYTAAGNPVKILAPLKAGEYELRYSTGQSHATLARAAMRITPAAEEPGKLSVTLASGGSVAAGSAVEIILDASGSMLQRIGKERRIDIARQTLTKLTSSAIPAGTPFALRVFGREIDSCQTDLEIPLSPLDAAAVGAKIGKLEAKNNARTPIGASLEKVPSDLQGVKGQRLVVLLTDGEETCGGDPAATIEKMKKAGLDVRVNIVGFAIDDEKLAATFRHWADAGGGMYFDAKDAAGLNDALARAMQPVFEVVDARGQVSSEGLAGGESVSVMPGAYTVRLKGEQGKSQPVTVRAKETSNVRL